MGLFQEPRRSVAHPPPRPWGDTIVVADVSPTPYLAHKPGPGQEAALTKASLFLLLAWMPHSTPAWGL